jgi:acyl carrier protein
MAQDVVIVIMRIIRQQLDVAEHRIRPNASFIDDLGADSLSLVELTLALAAFRMRGRRRPDTGNST